MRSPEFRSSSVLVAFLKTRAAQMKPGGQTPTNASAYQTLIAASTTEIPGETMINVSVTVMKTAVPINLNLIPGETTQTSALHAILNTNVVIIEEMSGQATKTVIATVIPIAANIRVTTGSKTQNTALVLEMRSAVQETNIHIIRNVHTNAIRQKNVAVMIIGAVTSFVHATHKLIAADTLATTSRITKTARAHQMLHAAHGTPI